MIQTFGTARLDAPDKPSPSNYMAYKGGFDFFPDHYQDQLVAGYSKTTASGALRVYMPDYNKIPRSRSNDSKPGE